jgi:ribosomal protein L37AE/L43A
MTGTGGPTGVSSWGEQRQPPFYCPYCAEEDLVPQPAEAIADSAVGRSMHGAWVCRSCLRIFAVRFLGLGVRA